jgi:hypothetical protein
MTLTTGCGGGADPKEPLSVTVSVDGSPTETLDAGESATIEADSGATLVLYSAVATSWNMIAVTSTYTVIGATEGSKSVVVSSNGGGTLDVVLSTSSGEQVNLRIVISPRHFERLPMRDGEASEWTVTEERQGSEPESSIYRRQVQLQADGYFVDETLADSDEYALRSIYDADDRELGDIWLPTGNHCFYSDAIKHFHYPMFVGGLWSGQAQRVCAGTYDLIYTGAVEAFESISTPAGTFDSLRVRVKTKYENFSRPDETVTSKTSVCWWAVEIGRNVKCELAYQYSGGVVPFGRIKTVTEELLTPPPF